MYDYLMILNCTSTRYERIKLTFFVCDRVSLNGFA